MKKRRKQEGATEESSDENKSSSTSFTVKDFALASLMKSETPSHPSLASHRSRQAIGVDLSVVTEVELDSEKDRKGSFIRRDRDRDRGRDRDRDGDRGRMKEKRQRRR
jgi:hypothetical protein